MMQQTATQAAPSTHSQKQTGNVSDKLLKGYPDKLFRGVFDQYSGQTVKYIPQDLGRGKACSRFVFERGEQMLHHRVEDDWNLNLAATGINLSTDTGGLIDGISFANGRDYLVWAFLDENYVWAGIGVTRKPYSAFSAIGGDGTAAKNESGVAFTVTNAYQFTIGARVAVRNAVGTAPQYEWNWAEITNITSSTAITLTMDNNTGYGVNITGATGGEIIQWDSFRPWVVTGSGQTLYAPYYSLVGEINTDAGSGDILVAYRADEEWRSTPNYELYNANTAANTLNISLGRYVPLWAYYLNLISRNDGPGLLRVNGIYTDDIVILPQAGPVIDEGNVRPRANVTVDVTVDAVAAQRYVFIQGYQVPGGMRG